MKIRIFQYNEFNPNGLGKYLVDIDIDPVYTVIPRIGEKLQITIPSKYYEGYVKTIVHEYCDDNGPTVLSRLLISIEE